MIYPAHFQLEPEGGYTVTFRDLSGLTTMDEALQQAEDFLMTALTTQIMAWSFPEPSSP